MAKASLDYVVRLIEWVAWNLKAMFKGIISSSWDKQ